MNLRARLDRIEGEHAFAPRYLAIVADDEDDAAEQYRSKFIGAYAAGPGPLTIKATVAGVLSVRTVSLPPWEDILKQLRRGQP